MNLFQNLVSIDELCSDALIQAVVGTVNNALTLIQVAVPIVLIVFCTIDMFKAFTNGDEKERAKAWKGAIKRIIFAVIVFIVPWLVKLSLSLLGRLVDTGSDVNGFETFLACWNNNVDTNDNTKELPAGKVCCYVGKSNDGTLTYSVVESGSCGNTNVVNKVNCGY